MEKTGDDIKTGLSAFLRVAELDARLSCSHISLFMVLCSAWHENGCRSPFHISRRKIMKPAKLSIATYHKCISELNRYGYLTYLPSFHPGIGSIIYLHFTPNLF